jgi:hypothetical protein
MVIDFAHMGDPEGQPVWNHATIEHTMPRARMGSNLFNNMLAAHYQCNNDRGGTHPSQELVDYHIGIHQTILDSGEYPITAQFLSSFQFMEVTSWMTGHVHADYEKIDSPFEVLLTRDQPQ